jgi:hypothetical protein
MPEYIGATKALAWAEEIISFLAVSPQMMRAKETASFLERLGSILIPGEPLAGTTRSRMEAFFGYDLKDVRVHRGPAAEELSRRLDARAFTLGGHIFGSHEDLDVSTSEGRGLLAHELTHAIQQTRPRQLEPVRSDSAGKLYAETISHETKPELVAPSAVYPEMVLSAPAQSSASATSPPEREAQAQANERLAAEGLTNEAESPPRINAEEVADRVYQLMQSDLVLERERAGRLGG